MLTEQQLEERLNYVTGSDAAVICGLSPFKTKLQLWMEKTGRAVQDDIGHLNHIKFGNYFEDGVAKWFEAESGKQVAIPTPAAEGQMLIHPEHKWMGGNLDRVVVGENAILECKTAFNSDGWGDGENIIPPYYLMQVAHYCAVGSFDRAYIAVVFATTREMRWYQYDRDLKLEEKLIAREKDFWENYVLADVCPEPENAKDILALYKETNNNPIIVDDEIAALVSALSTVNSAIKSSEETQKIIKEKIQLYMKDHDTLLDNSGKIVATWKYTKPINRFDAKQLRYDDPILWGKYMRTDEPQRRFNLTKGNNND